MYFDQLNIVKGLCMTGSDYHMLKNVPKNVEQNSCDDDINRAESDDENNINSEDENDKLTFIIF